MQFHTSILRRKQPIDSDLGGIAFVLKCMHVASQRLFVGQVVGPGLPGKDTELNLSHVQPTTMFGRVMKLQSMTQPISFSRLKGFIQSSDRMSVEVIQHHANDLGLGIGFIDQPFHAMSEVVFGAALSDLDMPVARLWFEKHEQVPCTVAFVLVIKPLHLTGTGRQRLPRFLDQLLTRFIKTDLGPARPRPAECTTVSFARVSGHFFQRLADRFVRNRLDYA